MAVPAEPDGPAAIEDYALIGDCTTAALVSRQGGIDWLCWPRFDSPACFAALLGTSEHGRWRIAPADPKARIRRAYRGDSAVLETRFVTADGEVGLIDFMPVGEGFSSLVRIVEGRAGRVDMRLALALRFDYGTEVPWVTRLVGEAGLTAVAGPDMVVLRTPVALRGEDLTTKADFTVAAGETVPFVLTYEASHRACPPAVEPLHALARTEEFWRDWSGRCTYRGPYQPAVRRSLVTLKALTFAPTGGIVAAPTTSLPEMLGGSRNWDYRFCWLRDATLTLLALMDAGYYDEAQAWRDWLQRSIAGSPDRIQIMYGLAGERRLSEWEADWLPGYQGARPVRIGNAAHDQLQLDVYGEVADALFHARDGGLEVTPSTWDLQLNLTEHLATIWANPDEGIWETRGGRRHFTHSKVMAWVAVDRAIRSAEHFGLAGPLDRWRALRDTMHADICARGFDAVRNTFVQSYGGHELDAALLLIPLVGFLPPDDPRVRGTLAAIERELLVDGFVRRYDTGQGVDGLPPGEGAFLACSFWLADNYALQGRHGEACALFERLAGLCNDVGLLAEEYDAASGRQVGNFPQAFSHIALVNTALALERHRVRPHAPRRHGSRPRRAAPAGVEAPAGQDETGAATS
jgi:GH15 family glucan-1,4-alpha-glucosidase